MLKALKFGTPIRLKRLAVAYPLPEDGTVYYDNVNHRVAVHVDTGWDYLSLGSETDRLQGSVGQAIDTDGAWLGFSNTFFLDSALTISDSLEKLDSQLGTIEISLQRAYDEGNEIITAPAEGDFSIIGTEDLSLGGSVDLKMAGTGNIDLTTNYITGQNVTLKPNTTGALISERSDAPVMNARGDYSIDLQLNKTDPTAVASGVSSTIVGGRENTVESLLGTIIGGAYNKITASGINSTVLGSAGYTADPNMFAIGNGLLQTSIPTDRSYNFFTAEGSTSDVRIGRAVNHDAVVILETHTQADSTSTLYAQDDVAEIAGQSFTPSVNGTVRAVTLEMKRVGLPDTGILIELKELSGDTPTTIIASTTVSTGEIVWDADNTFIFITPATVTAGTEYIVTISYDTPTLIDGTNYITWSGTTTSSYTDGDFFDYTAATWTRNDVECVRFAINIVQVYNPSNRLYLHSTENLQQSNYVYLSGEDTSSFEGAALNISSGPTGTVKVHRYSSGYALEEEYFDSIVMESGVDQVLPQLYLPTSEWKSMVAHYTLINTITGNRRVGRMYVVVNDAADVASITDDHAQTGDVGVTWTTAFDVLDNLELRYTVSDDCTMHVDVKRMRA